MNNNLRNKIIDIAKTKKDGVYTKDGWQYFVKDGNVKYFGNKFKGIYLSMGCFLTPIFEYNLTLNYYVNLELYNKAIKELRQKEFGK